MILLSTLKRSGFFGGCGRSRAQKFGGDRDRLLRGAVFRHGHAAFRKVFWGLSSLPGSNA